MRHFQSKHETLQIWLCAAVICAGLYALGWFALKIRPDTAEATSPGPRRVSTVPVEDLIASEKRSARRLRLASHFERQRNALRHAIRIRAREDVRRGLLCIHRFEGSWSDSGSPFWGGLQMDYGFQSTYGGPLMRSLGTADNWPAEAQLAVGTIAYYSGRGFGPWPNTRRLCGV